MESPVHGCDYQFKFDDNKRIVGFEIMGDNTLTPEHTRMLFARVFDTVKELMDYAQKHKVKVYEIKPDLSFDMFWKRYNNINGSKPKATVIWNKLSDKQKNLAMSYIDKYKQSLGSTTQAYATTYLNGQYWIK